MRAIVLVGGFGTRLRPLTLTTPKQMLPIVDRPMIEHVLAHLARHGIDDAVLSMGFRPEAFQAAYPDGVCAGVNLHYAIEPEPLDTAGAIRFAALDAGIDERFVVLNGDVLTDLDLGAVVRFHEGSGSEGTIALHEVDDPSAFGVVVTDDKGRVSAFVEKPPRHQAPSHLINAGTYVLEPSVIERIPTGRRVSIEREIFPAMVEAGVLSAVEGNTYWVDTGTPALYLAAQLDLIGGVRDQVLSGINPEARIDSTAKVENSVVAAAASIEANAVVRDSVVLKGAIVGAHSRIDGSIVGPGSVVGAGAVIEDLCVLGDDVDVAEGEHLRGVRRPEPTA